MTLWADFDERDVFHLSSQWRVEVPYFVDSSGRRIRQLPGSCRRPLPSFLFRSSVRVRLFFFVCFLFSLSRRRHLWGCWLVTACSTSAEVLFGSLNNRKDAGRFISLAGVRITAKGYTKVRIEDVAPAVPYKQNQLPSTGGTIFKYSSSSMKICDWRRKWQPDFTATVPTCFISPTVSFPIRVYFACLLEDTSV